MRLPAVVWTILLAAVDSLMKLWRQFYYSQQMQTQHCREICTEVEDIAGLQAQSQVWLDESTSDRYKM
jgi:hypothetical protein